MDQFEELKMLKELLDQGILTQDEFDAKKKEVLNRPAELSVSIETEHTQGQQGTYQTNTTGGLSTKATAIIGYLGLVFWFIAYVAGDKEGAKFHLNQSLVINLFMLLCVIPVLGWLWAIFMLIVWIMGIVYAASGEDKEVPLIGKIKILS